MNVNHVLLGAFALGVAMTCSGCSPIEPSFISPDIHGRVIDAATKTPIAGAEITLREWNGNLLVATRSTADGKIDIAEIIKFNRPLISMGLDAYVTPTTLEINASGYEPAQQKIEHRKPWTGTVELHRLPATN